MIHVKVSFRYSSRQSASHYLREVGSGKEISKCDHDGIKEHEALTIYTKTGKFWLENEMVQTNPFETF